MKKLSTRWKIYLIANYIQLAAFTLGFGCFIYAMFAFNEHTSARIFLYQWLFALGLLLISLNSSFNIHVVHRYFPDSLIPAVYKTTINVFAVINILLCIGMFYLCIEGFKSEMRDMHRERYDNTGLIFLSGFFFFSLLEIFILILQFQSFSYLKRNYNTKIATLIDSIGTS